MAQESSLGRIKIVDSGKELALCIHPETFQVCKSFQYNVEHCIGERKPLVSFVSGGVRSFDVKLKFDRDVDSEFKISDVLSFLEEIEKINADSRSASAIEFRLGDFCFIGFVEQYQFQPTRFDRSYQIQQANLDLRVIEEYSEEAS